MHKRMSWENVRLATDRREGWLSLGIEKGLDWNEEFLQGHIIKLY